MSKPITRSPATELAKIPAPTKNPSGDECFYLQGDDQGMPLVIGEKFEGAGSDLFPIDLD